jgi:hypothetical protein
MKLRTILESGNNTFGFVGYIRLTKSPSHRTLTLGFIKHVNPMYQGAKDFPRPPPAVELPAIQDAPAAFDPLSHLLQSGST